MNNINVSPETIEKDRIKAANSKVLNPEADLAKFAPFKIYCHNNTY